MLAAVFVETQTQNKMRIEIIKGSKEQELKFELIKEIIEKLDDLYDDLTYDKDEKEIEMIKNQIKVREQLLERLSNGS